MLFHRTLSKVTDCLSVSTEVGRSDIGLEQLEPRRLLSSYVVDTTVDESDGDYSAGDLSLREAIELANANAGKDTVTFDPVAFSGGGTIALAGTQIHITDSIEIAGDSLNQVTIDADDKSRIFQFNNTAATLTDLRFINGNEGNGGAIAAYASDLTFHGLMVEDSYASTDGGGLYVYDCTLNLNESTLEMNHAGRWGSALAIHIGEARIDSSQFAFNQGDGAIYARGKDVSVQSSIIKNNEGVGVKNESSFLLVNSSVIDNYASSGNAGGIYSRGDLLLQNSLVARNRVAGSSAIRANAAVYLYDGNAEIVNSTVSGNESGDIGAGVFAYFADVKVSDCTIVNNGIGLYNTDRFVDPYRNLFAVNNSIVAGNQLSDLRGALVGRNNVIGDAASSSTMVDGIHGNIVGLGGVGVRPLDSILEIALADNGGETKTHALAAESVARGSGDTSMLPMDLMDLDGDGDTAEVIPHDQIGRSRVQGYLDIGAVESFNVAPEIISSSVLSSPENQIVDLPFEAFDADSDQLFYNLIGGSDKDSFLINQLGELRFISPPDFDAPLDHDVDNVYKVVVSVSDGIHQAQQLVQVTVLDNQSEAFLEEDWSAVQIDEENNGTLVEDASPVASAGMTYVVDTLVDENDGDYSAGDLSLREAIELANIHAGKDMITFDSVVFSGGGTITLNGSMLWVKDSVDILGDPVNRITIDGDAKSRIMQIEKNEGRISHLHLTNSWGVALSLYESDLVFDNLLIEDNRGQSIYSYKTTLAIFDSALRSNSSGSDVTHFWLSDVSIFNSLIEENEGNAAGGISAEDSRIYIESSSVSGNVGTGLRQKGDNATMVVVNSSVSDNTVDYSSTAGIHSAGDLLLVNTVVSGNVVKREYEYKRGAVFVYDGNATIVNSTISGNKKGALGLGTYADDVYLFNSTVTGNEGGGLDNTHFLGHPRAGTMTIFNSIVAGNKDFDINGVVSGQSNVVGDANTSGGLLNGVNGNIVGISGSGIRPIETILQATLGHNGGATRTHGLVNGSVAIDAGDASLLPTDVTDLDGDGDVSELLPFDQNSRPRILGFLDIGAVEYLDLPPEILSADSFLSPENQLGPLLVDAIDSNGDQLAYSIVGGNDQSHFTINSVGELHFIMSPDFEDPKDNNADNNYELTIAVSDGVTQVQQQVEITVLNSRPPIITSLGAVKVYEGAAGPAYRITGFDPENDPLRFTIEGGADRSLFSVDQLGEIRFLSPPDFSVPQDLDSDNVYEIIIGLSDGDNLKTLSVAICVTDNQTPIFTSPSSVSVVENIIGSAYTITGNDPEDDPLMFSILGGDDYLLFDVNHNGEVSFRTSPDFESPHDSNVDNVYEIIVGLGDGQTVRTQSLAISVINNLPPVFTSPSTVNFVENARHNAYLISGSDPEGDPLTRSLVGGADQSLFRMPSPGQIYFRESPDFEVPLDDNADNVYEIIVKLDDGENEILQTVSISVIDNLPPVITSPLSSSVEENTTGSVYRVMGDDPENDYLGYSIVGGPDQSLFQIYGTGQVYFKIAPDYESPLDANADNVYEIIVALDDGETEVSQAVSISVIDNLPPVITSSLSSSVYENTTDSVYRLEGTDPENDFLRYSIVGGADQSLFQIYSSGQVYFTIAPDYESPHDANTDNVYEIIVGLDDGDTVTTQSVSINVIDNLPPVITSPASVKVDENTTYPVYIVSGSDPESNRLFYDIVGGVDQSLFSIDSNGRIRFVSPPDFETPDDNDQDNTYELIVAIDDGDTQVTMAIEIQVMDVQSILVVDTAIDESDGDYSSGDLSLREAIELANANVGPELDTVTFDSVKFAGGGTITLNGTHIEITDDLVLDGLVEDVITINAYFSSRHFYLENVSVWMSNLELEKGRLSAGDEHKSGGSIWSNNSDLSLVNMTFYANRTNNDTTSEWTNGGAIRFIAGKLMVANSTFDQNASSRDGGAILARFADAQIVNTTFSGNSSYLRGGALAVFDSTMTIGNSTFTGNYSMNAGGGLYHGSNSVLALDNSIVAGNTSPNNDDIGGLALTSGDNNVIGDSASSGGLIDGVNGNIVGVGGVGVRDANAILDTMLRDNGGPTMTHALLPGSVAVDAGDQLLLAADSFDLDGDGDVTEYLPVDQRGVSRVLNGQVDIGAFELSDVALVTNRNDSGPGSLRAAIEAANSNSGIASIRMLSDVSSIELASSVVYSGSHALSIDGGGASLKTLDGQEGLFDLLIANTAANLTIMNMIIEDGRNGVVMNMPALAAGTTSLALVNVLVQNNALRGVLMTDSTESVDSGLHFLSFSSQFVSNGVGQNIEGVLIEESGFGDVRTDIFNSAFVLNGGDGLAVAETDGGKAAIIVADSFFFQNGFGDCGVTYQSDECGVGLRLDETDVGGALVEVSNTVVDQNAGSGLEISESGYGSFAVAMADVIIQNNGYHGLFINEKERGELLVDVQRVTSSQSIHGSGFVLTEAGRGFLQLIAADVTADGNAHTGLLLNESDDGHLYAILERISTQFNGLDGFKAEEQGTGDMQGVAIDLTTVGNGGFGVNLIQDQVAGDVGSFLLYYLPYVNGSGPLSAVGVTVTP